MRSEVLKQAEKLILDELITYGYEMVEMKSSEDVMQNLKARIEIANGMLLSDREFQGVLEDLEGSAPEVLVKPRFKPFLLLSEMDDGNEKYIRVIESEWENNKLQVARISEISPGQPCYGVTVLLNGLPWWQFFLSEDSEHTKDLISKACRPDRPRTSPQLGLMEPFKAFTESGFDFIVDEYDIETMHHTLTTCSHSKPHKRSMGAEIDALMQSWFYDDGEIIFHGHHTIDQSSSRRKHKVLLSAAFLSLTAAVTSFLLL